VSDRAVLSARLVIVQTYDRTDRPEQNEKAEL
jgi:hypothetical protein